MLRHLGWEEEEDDEEKEEEEDEEGGERKKDPSAVPPMGSLSACPDPPHKLAIRGLRTMFRRRSLAEPSQSGPLSGRQGRTRLREQHGDSDPPLPAVPAEMYLPVHSEKTGTQQENGSDDALTGLEDRRMLG